ncbi:DNA polymerase III polC-type N-terminus, partial [Mycoplasma putrefaciens]
MDKKIQQVFEILDIALTDSDLLYLNDAKLAEPVRLSKVKTKAYFHIQIPDFLPIDLLKKIDLKFKNNDLFKLKLVVDVTKQKIDKELLIRYLNFIKFYKAESGSTGLW